VSGCPRVLSGRQVLFDPGKSRRNYKLALEKAAVHHPVVPHVGEQQTALVFTYEGNQAVMDDGLANIYRWRLAYRIIRSALDLQSKEYAIALDSTVLAALYSVLNAMPMEIPEADMLALSLRLQPEG